MKGGRTFHGTVCFLKQLIHIICPGITYFSRIISAMAQNRPPSLTFTLISESSFSLSLSVCVCVKAQSTFERCFH